MDLRIPINDSLTSCIGHLENINSLIYADFLNIDIFHYINQMNFISITTKVIESESYSVMSDSLQPHGLYSPWHSPGQNNRVHRFPFSRESSQPRDWTQVSCIAGGFFTSWATREAQSHWKNLNIGKPCETHSDRYKLATILIFV